MQVWNVLHAARWKCRTQKIAKNSPSAHHRTTLSAISLQLRHGSTIEKKLVKQQCLPHMSSQYGELQLTSGWDLLSSLGHPNTFQRVSHLGCVIARHSRRQPNFAALNRGRQLYLAGRPSGWALAHILVVTVLCSVVHWPTLLVVLVLGTGLLVREALISQHSILVAYAWFSRHWWMHYSVRLTVSTGALKKDAQCDMAAVLFWLTNLVIFCNGWH